MSKKIQYCTVILSDSVFKEINFLRESLSNKDGQIWNTSNTINLLLQFCFKENNIICAQNSLFLEKYFDGQDSFLNEFQLEVTQSATFPR